jgi:formate dehydrogenase subunit gamma
MQQITEALPDHPASSPSGEPGQPATIQRFVASERFVHWALAIPILVLYATAGMMVLYWGEPSPRPVRTMFSWLHVAAAVCLIVLPPVAILSRKREWRVHLANFKEGWRWTRDDLHWLILSPLAAVNHRITLPEQGKFNAAEKLNFMMVSATYPLYIWTGVLLWLEGANFIAWIVHLTAAALSSVLVVGHIYMAAVNPSTRIGLSGMITGWVDREWAKHHYRRWYRERFEEAGPAPNTQARLPVMRMPAKVRCGSCREVLAYQTWERLMQRVFQVEPLFCPHCQEEVGIAAPHAAPDVARAILQHLEAGSSEPFEYKPEPGLSLR